MGLNLTLLMILVILGFCVEKSIKEESLEPYVIGSVIIFFIYSIGVMVKTDEDKKLKEKKVQIEQSQDNKFNMIKLDSNKNYVIIKEAEID